MFSFPKKVMKKRRKLYRAVIKTPNNFLDYDVPIIKHLRQSFYKSCSKYLGMKTTDWNCLSWIYADWEGNQGAADFKVFSLTILVKITSAVGIKNFLSSFSSNFISNWSFSNLGS